MVLDSSGNLLSSTRRDDYYWKAGVRFTELGKDQVVPGGRKESFMRAQAIDQHQIVESLAVEVPLPKPDQDGVSYRDVTVIPKAFKGTITVNPMNPDRYVSYQPVVHRKFTTENHQGEATEWAAGQAYAGAVRFLTKTQIQQMVRAALERTVR